LCPSRRLFACGLHCLLIERVIAQCVSLVEASHS
jgi:hypothetical protein